MSDFGQVFEVSGKSGELEYRIQVRMTAPNTFIQRHIYTAPHCIEEDWIPSLRCCFEDASRRGKVVEAA